MLCCAQLLKAVHGPHNFYLDALFSPEVVCPSPFGHRTTCSTHTIAHRRSSSSMDACTREARPLQYCHCQSCTRGASSRNKPFAGGPTPPKACYGLPGILQYRGTSHCVCVEALSLAGIDRVGERARPCPLEARSVPLCVLTSLPHVCFHSPAHRAKRGVPHSRRSAGAAAAAALRCPGGSRRWWWWTSYSAWC